MVRAAPKPGVDGVPYTASNTFIVPDGDATVVARFQDEMAARQALMKTLAGFTSCNLSAGPGASELVAGAQWAATSAAVITVLPTPCSSASTPPRKAWCAASRSICSDHAHVSSSGV